MSGSSWLKWTSGVVCILGVFLGRVEAVASQSTTLQASFDCSLAAAPIEILICSDETLSALDKEMGERYSNVRNGTNEETERQVQLKEQRAWLKSRLTACKIPTSGKLSGDTSAMSACLIEETRKRSTMLAEVLNKKTPEISTQEKAVSSAENSTENSNKPVNNTNNTAPNEEAAAVAAIFAASLVSETPANKTTPTEAATPTASAITTTEKTSTPVNNTAPTKTPAPAVQTETPAAAPAQTPSSSETFVLSPPLDPKMAALLAHARENFKACRLKEALEETELVLAQTHAGAPEAIAQTNEFVDFTQVITNLINEAVELHNNGSYDSSVTKIQEAVDKCPTYPVAIETQQKIKISASNYYENQRVEERNRQIDAENQRVAEENARQQEQSSSSSDDEDCDEDGCW